MENLILTLKVYVYSAFLKDLAKCQSEVIIESPFITYRRLRPMSRDAKEAKYLKAFGKRLAEVRRAKGFTQVSLAEQAAGVLTETQVSD